MTFREYQPIFFSHEIVYAHLLCSLYYAIKYFRYQFGARVAKKYAAVTIMKSFKYCSFLVMLVFNHLSWLLYKVPFIYFIL